MTYTPTQPLTIEQFIAAYGDDTRYELADGELIDRSLTGPHEPVGGKLATQIGMAIAQAQLPWFIPRTCLFSPLPIVRSLVVPMWSCWMKQRWCKNPSGNGSP